MSDDLRQRILDEATRLFAQRGYGSTSVRELAEAVGVTKPTLYYHFGSKEQLFLAVVHHHIDQVDTLIAEALATPGTVKQRIAAFVHAYVTAAAERQDALRLLMTVTHPNDSGQPVVDVMSAHLRKIEHLTVLIQQGIDAGELRPVDPQAAVLALIGMADISCMACVYGLLSPVSQAERIVDFFFNGVGT